MESLANISEKFLDNFPEYVTYPERKRLVDADKVRLGVAFPLYIFITPFLLLFSSKLLPTFLLTKFKLTHTQPL